MAEDSTQSRSATQMFEEEARRWEETGKIQSGSANVYGLTRLRCWLHSKGAAADGVSERLKRYYQAAEIALARRDPDWYDDLLATRDYCSLCGETYRIENLSLCTHCDSLVGYCHQLTGGTSPNGNPKCPVCEDGEIVG